MLLLLTNVPLNHVVDKFTIRNVNLGHGYLLWVAYDGVRRVSGLCRESVVSLEDPTLIPTSRTELETRGSESSTRGSGSSFSVGCLEQCWVLNGDYRFPA